MPCAGTREALSVVDVLSFHPNVILLEQVGWVSWKCRQTCQHESLFQCKLDKAVFASSLQASEQRW